MKTILSLSLVMLATPASAHCYAVWHYKTPQHCYAHTIKTKPAVIKFHAVQAPAPITPPPAAPKDCKPEHIDVSTNEPVEREIGIQKLKELMK